MWNNCNYTVFSIVYQKSTPSYSNSTILRVDTSNVADAFVALSGDANVGVIMPLPPHVAVVEVILVAGEVVILNAAVVC